MLILRTCGRIATYIVYVEIRPQTVITIMQIEKKRKKTNMRMSLLLVRVSLVLKHAPSVSHYVGTNCNNPHVC